MFFDDFEVVHTKGPVVQSEEFSGNQVVAHRELEGLEPQYSAGSFSVGNQLFSAVGYNYTPNETTARATWNELGNQQLKNFGTLALMVAPVGDLMAAAGLALGSKIPAIGRMLGGAAEAGNAIKTEQAVVQGVADGSIAEQQTVTLYRGINENHPGYTNALDGNAVPRGGSATPLEHNTVTTKSPFTSWTTNPEVAKNFALRPNGSGVVMEKKRFLQPRLMQVLILKRLTLFNLRER